MHDYLLSTEMVRFAFIFGVAVSMMLYEKRHLTTGSIVVPGYIATFVLYPFVIVATFANALVSYWLINRFLRRWFLLYGRTKFTVLAMISIAIQTAMLKFTPSGPWLWESDFKLIVGVGYVVPALIAHDMGRQGIAKTTKSVLLAAAIVSIPIALALVLNVPGVNDLAPLDGFGDMALDAAWIPVAVFLSAAAAWAVASNFDLRSGGFVGAAFIGMLLADPWQVVVAAAIASLTYVLVTKVFMTRMILFGRRKFSAMLLTASSISWVLMWTGAEFFGPTVQDHLDLGSLALTPLFIPGLLANDAQRTSPRRVLMGVSLASSFVLTTTWWIQSLFENLSLNLGWKVVSVLSFTTIFGRQFVPSRSAATADEATTVDNDPVVVPEPVVASASAGATILQFPRSAAAYANTGFEWWAAGHPDAAASAKRWLTSVAADSLTPRLVGFRVTNQDSGEQPVTDYFTYQQIATNDMRQHDTNRPSRHDDVPLDQLRRAALNASRRRRAPMPQNSTARRPGQGTHRLPPEEPPGPIETVDPMMSAPMASTEPVVSLQLVESLPTLDDVSTVQVDAVSDSRDLPVRRPGATKPPPDATTDRGENTTAALPRRDAAGSASPIPDGDFDDAPQREPMVRDAEVGRFQRRMTLEERTAAKEAAMRAALPTSELDRLAEDVSANLGRGPSSLRWRAKRNAKGPGSRSAPRPAQSSPISTDSEKRTNGSSSPVAS